LPVVCVAAKRLNVTDNGSFHGQCSFKRRASADATVLINRQHAFAQMERRPLLFVLVAATFSYSPRSAIIGSVLDARRAGSAEAPSASSSMATAESTSTP